MSLIARCGTMQVHASSSPTLLLCTADSKVLRSRCVADPSRACMYERLPQPQKGFANANIVYIVPTCLHVPFVLQQLDASQTKPTRRLTANIRNLSCLSSSLQRPEARGMCWMGPAIEHLQSTAYHLAELNFRAPSIATVDVM